MFFLYAAHAQRARPIFFATMSCRIDPQFLGSYIVLSVTMSAARELGTNLAESAKERRLQRGRERSHCASKQIDYQGGE